MELALPPVTMTHEVRVTGEGDNDGDTESDREEKREKENMERERILALIPGLVLPTPSPTPTPSSSTDSSPSPSPSDDKMVTVTTAGQFYLPPSLSAGVTVVLSLSPEIRREEEDRLLKEQGQSEEPAPGPGLGLGLAPGLEQGPGPDVLSVEGYGQWLVDERQRLLLGGTNDNDDDDDVDVDDADDDDVDDDDGDVDVDDSDNSDDVSDSGSDILTVESPLDPPTPLAIYQQALQRRGLVIEALVQGMLRHEVHLVMQVTTLDVSSNIYPPRLPALTSKYPPWLPFKYISPRGCLANIYPPPLMNGDY